MKKKMLKELSSTLDLILAQQRKLNERLEKLEEETSILQKNIEIKKDGEHITEYRELCGKVNMLDKQLQEIESITKDNLYDILQLRHKK